ncbi:MULTISPECIES: tyrosine-type recombinase/integrase [unclassified Paenibacillus]|uniref:tyrosine-type recombinase/integrase n=1 Tax=unclassified Paenibacillus TaxID=185978 RepID=UPI001AE6DE95|nr:MULTISPECIES: tyrosine-type recombinase/integrase [unclassified Paenibacillus]MBP1155789.1 site-specific recombinase XerD [Paenibacillus sp. PvP091]MBP1168825.1 site-specific recombinase XerD [Paenibacillus sp. PvR098]MBP2439853.1 site-specific recombinase XerD [Paenibacillus sp. PvP052]
MADEYFDDELLELFDIWMKDQGFTPRTQKAYLGDVRLFLAAVAPKTLNEIEAIDVLRFLTKMRQGGAGDSARNRYLSSVRTFFSALIEYKYAQNNPALHVKKSKFDKNQIPSYLDKHLLSVFIESIEGKYQIRNVSMFLLMSYAGLRVSELHRLNISDFNRTANLLTVYGKGRKWRAIPLPVQLVKVLDMALSERISPGKKGEQAFFVSQFGRRISIRMIQKIAEAQFDELKEQFSELRGKSLSSHKLRHTFATMQVMAGTDIRTLQELLGHASIQTTQIYTHVGDKQKQEAMNRVVPRVPVSILKGIDVAGGSDIASQP